MKNIIAQLKRIWRLSKICHEIKLREEHRKRVSAPIRFCDRYCRYMSQCEFYRNYYIAYRISEQNKMDNYTSKFHYPYFKNGRISKDECSGSNPRLFKRDNNWERKLYE